MRPLYLPHGGAAILKKILFSVSALAVSAALGAGSAHFVTTNARLVGQEQAGHWTTNRLVGSEAAGPYVRAIVARRGLLALNRSEAAYFQRFVDAEGQPFQEACTYRIRGEQLPARWWGITIYAQDDFLPRNGSQAYSIDRSRVAADASGNWQATLSRERPPGERNWVSTRNAGRFLLTLRMYHPGPAIENTSELRLPEIERLSCEEEAS